MLLREDITINFRNPIRFVKQWWTLKYRIRAVFIWCLWVWKSNACDIWIDYGIRILGLELNVRRFIKK